MKRLIVAVAAVAFGAALLSAPTAALSVPGNSCNPPAGHGRSGCHRVTTAPMVKRKPVKKHVVRKHIVKAKAAEKPAVTTRVAATNPEPAPETIPAVSVVATPASAAERPVAPVAGAPAAPAHTPWWVAIWSWLVK